MLSKRVRKFHRIRRDLKDFLAEAGAKDFPSRIDILLAFGLCRRRIEKGATFTSAQELKSAELRALARRFGLAVKGMGVKLDRGARAVEAWAE